jgi:large subunit ribosomal protein L22
MLQNYMEIISEAKYIRVSPRKMRLVAQAVKKLTPQAALDQLSVMPKSAALPIALALKSAIANASHNNKLTLGQIYIKEMIVSGGPVLKRFQPVSRGRAHSIKKRMSHIKVILADNQSQSANLKSQNVKSQMVVEKEKKEEKQSKSSAK